MKNNLKFLLAFGNAPFDCIPLSSNVNIYGTYYYGYYAGTEIIYPSDYVYASYLTEIGAYDQFLPFEDNCIFSNFQYNASFGTPAHPNTYPNGIGISYSGGFIVDSDVVSTFPTYSYVTSGSQCQIQPSLIMSSSQWFPVQYFDSNPDDLAYYGVYQSGTNLYMNSGATNAYGLPFLSYEVLAYPSQFNLLSPGHPAPATEDGTAFASVQPPALSTVGYYFARMAQFELGPYGIQYHDPSSWCANHTATASTDARQ